MRIAALLRRSLVLLALLWTFGPTPSGAVDATGKWLLDDGALPPGTLVDVVQAGSTLSIDLGPVYGVLTGSIVQTGSFSVSIGSLQDCLSLLAGTLVGDSRLVGDRAISGQLCSTGLESGAGAERCQCVDGNSVSGDGCDARCQVEPCFTCTGSPSVCTVAPDGATCDDHDPCATGRRAAVACAVAARP